MADPRDCEQPARPTHTTRGGTGERKTFVIDTSVLLADPGAMTRFAEHEVVIPLVVLEELEAKRNHPELGWAARRALRKLEWMRCEHGTLTEPMPVNDAGGVLFVEINHRSTDRLPEGFRVESNDDRILVVAMNLMREGRDVVVVSKDLPLRLRASVFGLGADEYRNEQAPGDGDWTGYIEIDVDDPWTINQLYDTHTAGLPDEADGAHLPVNTGVTVRCGSQSALARVTADKNLRWVRPDVDVFGVHGKSAQQRLALDMLTDDSVGIVSLGGPAGTGKTLLALAAGLEQVVEQRKYRRILVFRPLYAVGGQDLGFLPGDQNEKMGPWAGAVWDALEAICSPEVIDEIVNRAVIEVLPLTHIRGRTLNNSFVIVDEAQNLERMVLLTALSRVGANSKVVLTHDVAQRDNLGVSRYDGIAWVVNRLMGDPLFAHMTLAKSERSAVAALVTRLLDDLSA